jgi:hypothetical protein
MHHEVDTESSPAGQALEAALADSAFFEAAAADGDNVVGADIPRWTITVDADGQRRTVTFADDGNPGNARWRRLLDRILAS